MPANDPHLTSYVFRPFRPSSYLYLFMIIMECLCVLHTMLAVHKVANKNIQIAHPIPSAFMHLPTCASSVLSHPFHPGFAPHTL